MSDATLKPLLLVMNPRRIPAAIRAIDGLAIDKVWMTCFWEKELETVIAAITKMARRLEYTHLILLSDDTVPSQAALEAVLQHLPSHPVVTGYCNLDATLPFVNLTKTPFRHDHESFAGDYDWYTRDEVDTWPAELVPTCFGGACLTGMSVEMWERFPFQVLSRPDAPAGYASDWKLSVRLQKAGIPIVAPKRAFVRHLKTVWLEGPAQEKDPAYRLLMGSEPSAIRWNLQGTSRTQLERELNAQSLPTIPPLRPTKSTEAFDPIAYWTKAGKNESSPDHEARFASGPVFEHQEARLLATLSKLRFSSILEVGCGFGRITKLLRERYPEVPITAVDLSRERLRSARRRLEGASAIEFVESTIQDFNPSWKWDLVLAVETLMHVPSNEIESVVRKLTSLSNRYVVNLDWDKPLGDAPVSPHNWLHDYERLHGLSLVHREPIGLQGIYCRHADAAAAQFERAASIRNIQTERQTRSFKICLTMIVKNEARVIARCLESAKPFIDQWCIVDTGSEDETADAIRTALEGVPGELHRRPWKGFGQARTDAFDLALTAIESDDDAARWYGLVLDADELISGEMPSHLTAPSCSVWLGTGKMRYKQLRMFQLSRRWRYEGVLHEFPTCDGSWSDEALSSIMIASPGGGARSRSPDKFKKDAAVFEDAIRDLEALGDPTKDPLKTRYVFYLAQSYRDARDDTKAAEAYLRRAEMGGGLNWEEIYVSLLEAGRALERLGLFAESDKAFLRAHHTWAQRPEAVRELQRIFAYRIKSTKPIGNLFVESG